MYKLIGIIFLSWLSLSWAANHYVDKNANGLNDGTSWTDAWESFGDINWDSVNPGDIVFISGGTDSTIYNERLRPTADGTADNLITIRKGWDAGHDGKVIIQGTIYETQLVMLYGRSYLRVVNLDVRNGRNGIRCYGGNVLYIDSCSVTNCQYGINVANSGAGNSDSIFIWNSSVRFLENNTRQTDCISGTGCAYLEIKNCYVYQGNELSASGHSDCTQILGSGKQIYANNWMESVANPIDPHSSASAGHNGQGGSVTDTSLWFNNVMITRGWSYTMYHDAGTRDHTWLMYNNNIIKEYDYSDAGCIHTIEYATFGKNNIIYTTNDSHPAFMKSQTLVPGNENFDYNLWYHPNYNNIVNSYTFAEWQAVGGDLNGKEGDPLFVNWSDLDLRLQNGSPCIDAGTADVKALVEEWGLTWESFNNPYIDWANGGARSETTPTIGVYEYTEEHGNLDSKNYSYTLCQNYPNPFNSSTVIEYYNPQLSRVKLVVYDMIGQEVRTLVDGEKASGLYEVEFNAANLQSGIYFYRLQAANFVETRKMVLLR